MIGRGERRRDPGKQSSEERPPGERRRLEKGRSQEEEPGEGEREGPRQPPPASSDPRRRSQDEEAERQRQREEEFQTRYRSDPNLARYPVKPQKEEQEMRMHAKVSKVRHERHHSEMALNEVGQGRKGPGGRLGPGRGHVVDERQALMENHRAYSVDRTAGGGGSGGGGGGGGGHGSQGSLHKPGHGGPPPPRTGPLPPELRDSQEWGPKGARLEPAAHKGRWEKVEQGAPGEGLLRIDSLSSDQSESLRPPPPRPYKGRRGGGNKRQMSISSSEEEGGSTPEYTSCEDVEMESISERGMELHHLPEITSCFLPFSIDSPPCIVH